MKKNREGNFEDNMEQLIQLLKRIVKSHPDQTQLDKLQRVFKDQGINVNFCFFNFFPMTDEELDELEEICEQYLGDTDKRPEDLTMDLSQDDLEFLKKNGIRYF